jgi:hypothetical protein
VLFFHRRRQARGGCSWAVILYNKGYASHTVALPFTLKSIILRQKEKLWKLKYFKAQKYNP